ncbi:hypothetical protein [Shewanella sp. UCD-KL12]|uniref:hypothetical protein n=1 Tax=Shewanella sp. UCD-KL12 TaxID=1917163 RepID=UPI00097093EE|nr:hypothetical protein [Shewanella sp. UCD-KL12]
MFKINTFVAAITITLVGLTSTTANAATVGCERAGGIKCQKVHSKRVVRTPVVIVPSHHHHYNAFHSPMLTALGIAIVLDAAGNAVTEKGQQVVVLGEGNEVKNVYEKDGVVYLVKA